MEYRNDELKDILERDASQRSGFRLWAPASAHARKAAQAVSGWSAAIDHADI